MNRNELIRVLEAAEIHVDGRWNVARLRTVFAENRQACEQLLVDENANDDELPAADEQPANDDENNEDHDEIPQQQQQQPQQPPPPQQQQNAPNPNAQFQPNNKTNRKINRSNPMKSTDD